MSLVFREIYDIHRCKNMPRHLGNGLIDYEKWAEEQHMIYKAELHFEQRPHK